MRPPYWQVRLWRTLRTDPLRALLVGVVLGVVLAFLGAIGSLGGSTTWTSKTVMLINDPFALATAGDQGQLLKLDALRIKYSGLVATNVIAQPVARELNLPTEKVLKSVTTQVPLESLLMNVVATWSNPNEARRLSQAVADQV
ncbi:MAG: hypothetical protein ACRD0I_01915, partial [Acidimicrobiales bacterium]